MRRIQRAALATSSAVLCAATIAGCGALRGAPVSNAKANDNPAIGRANAYEGVQQQAESQSKSAAQSAAEKKASRDAGTNRKNAENEADDMRPVAKSAGVPAWVTVINWAQTKLGHKYIWGGDGYDNPHDGFDCSGLMKAAYAEVGIELPRVANDQYQASNVHPKRSELLPGDLVFYGKTERGIHHVGLYVGSGMMLHAPNSRSKIRFDKIDYMSDYYGATRIIR